MPFLPAFDTYATQLLSDAQGRSQLGPYRCLEPLPMDLPSWDGATWDDLAKHWQHRAFEGLAPTLPDVLPGKLLVRNRPHDLYQQLNPANTDASLDLSPLALNEALRQAVEPFNSSPAVPTLMRQELSVMLLLARGARCTDEALARAVLTGNPRLVYRLLTLRVNEAWETEPATFRESPLLIHAAQSPGWAMDSAGVLTQILIDAGASPHLRDRQQGRTALHWAATNRRSTIVRALLDAGADANAPNRHGHTPVHYAAARNDVASLQALLEHGGDLDRHVPLPSTLSVGRSVPLSFETPLLGQPTLDDQRSTWVPPSFVPAPRPRRQPMEPQQGYEPTGAPSGTQTTPNWAIFTQPKPTVIPPHRAWRDTPMTQAAFAGAHRSLAWLQEQGIDLCPPLDPGQPDGPRDERVLALLEGAWRRAREEGDEGVQEQAMSARALVERRLLNGLDLTPSNLPSESRPGDAPRDEEPTSRTRPRL